MVKPLHRLNWPLVVATFAVLLAVVLGGYGVHRWQMSRYANNQYQLADDAREQGDTQQEIVALSRYLRFHPADQATRLRYALLLARTAQYPADRWRALQTLLPLVQRADAPLEAVRSVGQLALEVGEPTEALKVIEAALARFPDDVPLRMLLAQLQQECQQSEAALTTLRQILRQNPRDIEAGALLARLLTQRRDLKQADAVLEHVLLSDPRNVAVWIARARHRRDTGRFDRAEEDLAEAARLDPRQPDIWQLRADMAQRRGLPELARVEWRKALALQADRVDWWLGLARAEQDSGDLSAALKAVERALALSPNDSRALLIRGDILVQQNQLEAAGRCRLSLRGVGSNGGFLYLGGRLAQARSRWLEAISLYEQALASGDLSAAEGEKTLRHLVDCFGQVQAPDEQIHMLRQAMRLQPTPQTRLQLGELLLQYGQAAAALPILRPLQKEPATAQAVLPLLGRALLETNRSLPAEKRDWSELEAVLQQLQDIAAWQAERSLLQADMLAQRGQESAAVEELKRAKQQHPDDPRLLFALADQLAWKGQLAEARALLVEGERRFANRLDWLFLQADRLALQPPAIRNREWHHLESLAEKLAPAQRQQFDERLLELYTQVRNSKDMERLAQSLLARDPDSISARQALARVSLSRRDFPEAQSRIQQIRQLEGELGSRWRELQADWYLTQAESTTDDAVRRNNLILARPLIAQLRIARPNWSRPAVLAGRLADLEGRSEEALKAYLDALRLNEPSSRVLVRAVQILSQKQRYSEAFHWLDQALRSGRAGPALNRLACELAVATGRYDRAAQLAHRAVSADSPSVDDQLWLARQLDAMKRTIEARDILQSIVQRAPADPETHLALIDFLHRHGTPAEVEQAIQEMMQSIPTRRRELALAQSHEILGRFRQAEAAYQQLLAQQPRNARVMQRLAALYLRINQPLKAVPLLRSALALAGQLLEEELPELRRQLALAWTAPEQTANHVDAALAWLARNRQEGAESELDDRVAWLVRASRPETREAALQAFQSRTGALPLSTLEQWRLAQLLDAQGQWPAARDLFLQQINADPDNPGLVRELVDRLLANSRWAEATQWLARLEKLDPHEPRLEQFRTRLRQKIARDK